MTVAGRITISILLLALCLSPFVQATNVISETDLYQRAIQAKERGDFSQAITLLRTALSRKPTFGEARFQLGMIFFELKRWRESEEEFRKYVQQHPDSFQAHNNLAAIYAQLGMLDSLARELKTVVKLRPDYSQGFTNLGDFYLTLAMRSLWHAFRVSSTSEQPPLRQKLERVLVIAAAGPEVEFIRGHLARIQGDRAAARDYFKKAAQADQDYAPTHLMEEARRLAQEGELEDALDDLAAILVLEGNNGEASLLAGEILVKEKKYQLALEQLQKVPPAMQKDSSYSLTMAAALRGVGEPQKSVSLLESAMSQQGNNELRRQLAEAYKANGDYTKAVAEYEKLLSTEPDPSWVRKEILDLTKEKLRATSVTNGSRKATGRSADGPVRLPDALAILPANGRCVIVEKESQTLLLFRKTAAGFELEKSYACSTGAKEGEKSSEGDHKTPEGIYLFKNVLPGNKLSAIYGKLAITLDYPNPYDRIEGKGGDGIWLHATNEPIRPYLPNKTRGCVVVSNNDIEELSKLITLNQTPLVIVSKIHYQTPEELESNAASLRDFIEKWRQNWESKSIGSYIGMYSSRFRNGDQNLKAYKSYKEGVFSRAGRIQVRLDLESAVRHEKYAMLTVRQEYRSNRLSSMGTKRLFAVREGGNWRIIAETMR